MTDRELIAEAQEWDIHDSVADPTGATQLISRLATALAAHTAAASAASARAAASGYVLVPKKLIGRMGFAMEHAEYNFSDPDDFLDGNAYFNHHYQQIWDAALAAAQEMGDE